MPSPTTASKNRLRRETYAKLGDAAAAEGNSVHKSIFRYPGSKDKIARDILSRFPNRIKMSRLTGDIQCYCEPFIGCGAIAMKALPLLPSSTSVIFGDMDFGLVCLWRSIARQPNEIVAKIMAFKPTTDDFYRFKELDGSQDGDPVELGFRKFVLHQMSFSGLGAMAGGPIGGRGQRSDYDVTCRFRPERHAKQLKDQHRLLSRFKSFEVVHGDFEKTISKVPDDGFTYLDPPYYLQGAALYVNNMSPEDHERLADVLRSTSHEWVLSYDDHQSIRDLYSPWANIDTFEMVATIDTKRGAKSRRKNRELVITPKGE